MCKHHPSQRQDYRLVAPMTSLPMKYLSSVCFEERAMQKAFCASHPYCRPNGPVLSRNSCLSDLAPQPWQQARKNVVKQKRVHNPKGCLFKPLCPPVRGRAVLDLFHLWPSLKQVVHLDISRALSSPILLWEHKFRGHIRASNSVLSPSCAELIISSGGWGLSQVNAHQ